MKICEKCGKELLDEAVICPGCGCETNINVSTPKRKFSFSFLKSKKILSIILVFIIILGIGSFFVCYKNNLIFKRNLEFDDFMFNFSEEEFISEFGQPSSKDNFGLQYCDFKFYGINIKSMQVSFLEKTYTVSLRFEEEDEYELRKIIGDKCEQNAISDILYDYSDTLAVSYHSGFLSISPYTDEYL